MQTIACNELKILIAGLSNTTYFGCHRHTRPARHDWDE